MGKFVIRAVPSGMKFDLHAANGQSILTSEVYTSCHACRKGMESVRRNAPIAKLEDQTDPEQKPLTNPKFELYLDRAGFYRFRLKARNGEIIALHCQGRLPERNRERQKKRFRCHRRAIFLKISAILTLTFPGFVVS